MESRLGTCRGTTSFDTRGPTTSVILPGGTRGGGRGPVTVRLRNKGPWSIVGLVSPRCVLGFLGQESPICGSSW